MVKGSCHCGAVRIEVPRAPDWVGSCNCSLCSKTGWLVAYYPGEEVSVEGETVAYVWGDRMIGIHHCPTCGVGTHWKTLGEDFGNARKEAVPNSSISRMGVHARLLDGFDATGGQCSFAGVPVEVRMMDNREG